MDEPTTRIALGGLASEFAVPSRSTPFNQPPGLSSYELQPAQITDNQEDNPDNRVSGLREFILPPVDQGKDAWLCLMGAFFLEMIVWGMFYAGPHSTTPTNWPT